MNPPCRQTNQAATAIGTRLHDLWATPFAYVIVRAVTGEDITAHGTGNVGAMNVRRWRPTAQIAWTLTALAVASPLLVEPALQIVEPGWQAADTVLLPTLAVLGFAMIVNLLFSLGALIACPKAISSAADSVQRAADVQTSEATRTAR